MSDFTPPPAEPSADGHHRTVTVDAELLADVGHQLRNQLNAVVGAAGLLANGAENSDERELAKIVEAGAEQVARIVDDVLDAATLESGEFELALHPFDVRSTVESCLALIADSAGAKGLDVSFNAASDAPTVVIGDSRRLEQILLTLLHAAVERTFRGGIGVELGCEDRNGLVALHFRIRDTGRGVPARILRGGLDGVTGPYDKLEPGDRLAVLSLRTTKQLVEL
ncbi:MAG TPA: HAMP domain-containing sensor histidine kinase, partial [Candidatus Dormibacteraeota bacterium]|nr:HAMP domain-containing sensor histidine kinase [Candidatus Dormibacteraeota bacterium]